MSQQLIYLTERISNQAKENCLILHLSAKERTQLRGRRLTSDGTNVILNLPRGGGRLIPGEILKSINPLVFVFIKAGTEDLIRVRSSNRLKLLKAAYNLGNRHVEIEMHDKELYLLKDVVIKNMLEKLGFEVKNFTRPFSPESGAYE